MCKQKPSKCPKPERTNHVTDLSNKRPLSNKTQTTKSNAYKLTYTDTQNVIDDSRSTDTLQINLKNFMVREKNKI